MARATVTNRRKQARVDEAPELGKASEPRRVPSRDGAFRSEGRGGTPMRSHGKGDRSKDDVWYMAPPGPSLQGPAPQGKPARPDTRRHSRDSVWRWFAYCHDGIKVAVPQLLFRWFLWLLSLRRFYVFEQFPGFPWSNIIEDAGFSLDCQNFLQSTHYLTGSHLLISPIS